MRPIPNPDPMGNFPSNDAGVADTPGTATAASQEDAHVEIMATPGREQIVTGENAILGTHFVRVFGKCPILRNFVLSNR